MRKIKLSYNRKKEILHISFNYTNFNLLKKIVCLLKISFLTVVNDNRKEYEIISKIKEDQIFDTIKLYEIDKNSASILIFDGALSNIESNCEISYLTQGLIRFFLSVNYSENEIHILINAKKYDNILNQVKNVKI